MSEERHSDVDMKIDGHPVTAAMQIAYRLMQHRIEQPQNFMADVGLDDQSTANALNSGDRERELSRELGALIAEILGPASSAGWQMAAAHSTSLGSNARPSMNPEGGSTPANPDQPAIPTPPFPQFPFPQPSYWPPHFGGYPWPRQYFPFPAPRGPRWPIDAYPGSPAVGGGACKSSGCSCEPTIHR